MGIAHDFIWWERYLPVLKHLPDIFHVQWSKDVEYWTFLKEFGVKMVVSFRGNQMDISPICDKNIADMYRHTLPLYDAYHCVSKAIMTEGCKYGALADKCSVIYPAVRTELLTQVCKNKKMPSATLQILSVGRDHWKKGYRVAIDAMKLLKDRGVPFHYTIVAGGEKQEIIFQINQLGLTGQVTLIDNLPHGEVLEKYSLADVFLLPSFEEGVANVVLEAMALGTPVITTNCGGMTEVITDGVNGFVIPLRNADAIANAIIKVKELDSTSKAKMIMKARETIESQHLLRQQVDKMVEFYTSVLND